MAPPATIRVHVASDVDGTTLPVGVAYVNRRGDQTTVNLTYATDYLADPRAYPVSPDLPLSHSRHSTDGLPGAFADSAPDRWGRNLIAKRHRARTRGSAVQRSLGAIDYLLGVSDATRQGSLRFALEDDGPFLADDLADGGVPQLLELPRLLAAADEVARDPDDLAAIKVLLDAGTGTLGGARPKASVRDGDRLLIAKFPHHGDDWDVMGWEKTALDLADVAGIHTPPSRLITIEGSHVLLLDRFDRDEDASVPAVGGRRLPYVSAMTLIGASDDVPADYLELAEAMSAHGGSVTDDLAQLWRRIAFSLVVNNTDDHMRNHGFLHGPGGWVLAPAFDVNPDPDVTRHRASTIGFTAAPDATLPALLASSLDFRLRRNRAEEILSEVVEATSGWRDVATANGVPERELERFAPALDRFR
jgi:serine/threonine-protein kinase HipA